MSDWLIVIPAFNEARTIADVVTEARRHGPVLVVDDGSGDRTSAAARGAGVDDADAGAASTVDGAARSTASSTRRPP